MRLAMPAPHEHRLRVRYSETDQMGVVHHSSYLVYLEEGRLALMRSLGFPYEEVERRGLGMAVRSVEVRYRAAARYGDELFVLTTIERLRGASIRYGYEVQRVEGRETLATGAVEVACLALRGEFKPVPVPDDIRAAVERYVAG